MVLALCWLHLPHIWQLSCTYGWKVNAVYWYGQLLPHSIHSLINLILCMSWRPVVVFYDCHRYHASQQLEYATRCPLKITFPSNLSNKLTVLTSYLCFLSLMNHRCHQHWSLCVPMCHRTLRNKQTTICCRSFARVFSWIKILQNVVLTSSRIYIFPNKSLAFCTSNDLVFQDRHWRLLPSDCLMLHP